jgi:glycosyltransferase involved in cell wall biosynthesis
MTTGKGTAVRVPVPNEPRVLVAIPACNEEATISAVVGGVPRAFPGATTIHSLVVDDGSTDDTAARALAAGAAVVRHGRNLGLGKAFHSALEYMIERGYDILVTIDADGQFDPKDIAVVATPVISGEYDFATASRFLDPRLIPAMPRAKRLGNRAMSALISSLAGVRLHDVSCGMRCYSRRAALRLHLLGSFTYTQEVILNLAFKGLRLAEVPLRVRGVREHGESRVARSLWSYAWQTIKIVFRAYRDYHPMRFFGGLAVALLLPSIGLGAWLGIHFLRTGNFSPHKWAGFGSLALLLLAVALLLTGLVGDMLNRQRIYLEEMLFRLRSQGVESSFSGQIHPPPVASHDAPRPDQH